MPTPSRQYLTMLLASTRSNPYGGCICGSCTSLHTQRAAGRSCKLCIRVSSRSRRSARSAAPDRARYLLQHCVSKFNSLAAWQAQASQSGASALLRVQSYILVHSSLHDAVTTPATQHAFQPGRYCVHRTLAQCHGLRPLFVVQGSRKTSHRISWNAFQYNTAPLPMLYERNSRTLPDYRRDHLKANCKFPVCPPPT